MNTTISCPSCKSHKCVKNGSVHGKQRYKCNACQKQFLVSDKSSVNFLRNKKRQALILYLEGMSFRAIAKYIGINHMTIYSWIDSFKDQLNQLKKQNSPDSIDIAQLLEIVKNKNHNKNIKFVLIDIDTDQTLLIE